MSNFKTAGFLTLLGILGPAIAHGGSDRDLLSEPAIPAAVRAASGSDSRRAWALSLVPLLASQSLDAVSSYGYSEVNPLLRGANQQFGPQSTALKFAFTGALVGVEYLVVRKSPRSAKTFKKLNWTSSAITTGLAVRNYAVR